MSTRPIAAFVALCVLAAACSDGKDATSTTTPLASTTAAPETTTSSTEPALGPATFTVRPGVQQIAVLGAAPGDTLSVWQSGQQVADGAVDAQGSLLFRDVEEGDGYTIRSATAISNAVQVSAPGDLPPQTLYIDGQTLLPKDGGFGYITTRDGTTLSANVILPGPAAKGPYPTVVEYSGYQPSDPDSAQLAALYTAQGFAYVGVNMRGTGCSGGSFQFFETAQSVDGYDVVEAVAAQPWVMDHQVGMVGLSYPGISQLFVAATQPPSLNSITPLSVIDDTLRGTLYPGGILNTGFAVEWGTKVTDKAVPFGQGWTKQRADAGDTRCADNQKLRLQNPDVLSEIDANPYYTHPFADSVAPITFVNKIKVPVFIAGAWQDEQTGGHFPAMLANFTGSPHVYITLVNGLHTESLSPPVARRYMEFLQLYVGKKVPDLSVGSTLAAALGGAIWGVTGFGPFENRFKDMTYAQALAAFEADKAVRVLFEQGGNPAFAPGTPEPYFTREFEKWPIPQAVATAWGLGDKGALVPGTAAQGTTDDSYTADPKALPATFYTGDGNGVWRADVKYDWRALPDGKGVGYVTAPLDKDTVVVGAGSVDLWLKASTEDTDLEVTVSEVRPDGTEIYVQSGWLRASQRALDAARSTDLAPVYTNAEADSAPLPAGEFTEARVALFPFAHPFRAGSRIRLTVDAPGNSRAIWQFRTIDQGETVTIAHDAAHPSQLLLPVVDGIDVPKQAPAACGALRGEPCRLYTPAANGG